MAKTYSKTALIKKFELPVFHDLEGLASCIGISKKLLYLLSQQSHQYYKCFEIPKKDSSSRSILAPKYPMKLVQRWILFNILEKLPVSYKAMAFKKKQNGIKENALVHIGKRYTLQVDLKDFFTSIPKEKVFKVFMEYGYNDFIADVLSNICTYEDYLPQGGVCSPFLSNLVASRLDCRLIGLCKTRDVVYSRYADDMSFSADNKIVLGKLLKVINQIIEDEGFEINDEKTRFLTPKSSKNITGININSGNLKASKKLKREVRAMIHRSIMSGNYENNDKIIGCVAYVKGIEDDYKERIIRYIEKKANQQSVLFNASLVEKYNKNKFFKELKDL